MGDTLGQHSQMNKAYWGEARKPSSFDFPNAGERHCARAVSIVTWERKESDQDYFKYWPFPTSHVPDALASVAVRHLWRMLSLGLVCTHLLLARSCQWEAESLAVTSIPLMPLVLEKSERWLCREHSTLVLRVPCSPTLIASFSSKCLSSFCLTIRISSAALFSISRVGTVTSNALKPPSQLRLFKEMGDFSVVLSNQVIGIFFGPYMDHR